MSADLSPTQTHTENNQERRYCALVALDRNVQPSVNDVARKLAQLFPKLPPARDLVEDESGFGFFLCSSTVGVVRMAGPVPVDPNDAAIVKKPLKQATLETQQAYLVIAIRESSPLQAAIAATEVTAAIVECCPSAIAVFWPGARQWLDPQYFADQAVKHVHSRPPIDIWVDVCIWQLDGKQQWAGHTRGLKALGHKEFEVRSSPESASDLRSRLEGLCWYVLTNGPVVRDGHTIGHDCLERISVLLCRSAHGLPDLVLRLDYDEDFRPRRPWWKLI